MLNDAAKSRLAALLEEMSSLGQFYDRTPLAVNTVGSNGDTPLIVALIREDLQSTLDLPEAGADPNAVGEDDFSALHWAAKAGPEFVQPLLARGAIPRGKNIFGDTPQNIARKSGNPKLIALFDETRDA